MFFTAPLWLLALLPFGGVVLWLLWGRRRKTPVAFLDLWRGPALLKPAKRALQPPPVFLRFAILAMLSAIFAGTRPRIFVGHRSGGKQLTIIVDRGISMSATSHDLPRFRAAATEAANQLAGSLDGSTPVELIAIPGDEPRPSQIATWLDHVEALSPTAIDTSSMLVEQIRNRLANSDGAVVVISGHALPIEDPRLVQFAPDGVFENVGIVQISARQAPSPQVMVTLQNDSARKTAGVKIISGSIEVSRMVELPPTGQRQDYFFDFSTLDAQIEALLNERDDQPADDRAWLLREGSYPRIEARSPVAPELRRMIDVYSHSRPAGEGSATIAIVTSEDQLPADAPAIWVPQTNGAQIHGIAAAIANPITANVNWSAIAPDIQTAAPMPRGWTPIVSIASQPVVAIRGEPSRKIWIGFDAGAWSATPDYVVFWANTFTWIGQGRERFTAWPLAHVEPGWKPIEISAAHAWPGAWPGIYRTDEGLLRAYNPPAVARYDHAVTTPDWRKRLLAAESGGRGGYDLTPVMLIVAILGLIGAAATWKRPGLTPVWAGRTF